MIKNKRSICWCISAMVMMIALLQTPHFVKAEVSVEGNTIHLPEERFDGQSLEDETGTILFLTNEDYLLEGLTDSVEFYYEMPLEGMEEDNFLQLHVAYSTLLLKGSSVTVYIDDQPIHSEQLLENKTEMNIKIPLKGDVLQKGFHHVTISFYGHIAENLCANEENPANWLTILSTSHLHLHTKEFTKRDNLLQDYPYPFIQHDLDESIQSTLVIPDNPSTSVLTSAVKLASYLSNQTTDTSEVKIIQESELDKISTHLIVIGPKDQWNGLIGELFHSINIEVPKSELVIRNRFLQFSQMTKQVMFVTAENDQIISEKIAILTENEFVEQLSGNDVTIDKMPVKKKEAKKSNYTFTDMSIPNITLNGLKAMSQNYFYYVPTFVNVNENASLHLKVKVSDTLFQRQDNVAYQKEDAELVIYMNEIPHSIAIDDLNQDEFDGFYEVEIPIESKLLKEAPFLTFQFKGHGLKNREICVPPTDEKWIYIHEDSYIRVPLQDETSVMSFATWPAPFVSTMEESDTTVVLPNELNQDILKELQLLTSSLGAHATLDGLEIIHDQDVEIEELKDRHVIFLGNMDEHNNLTDVKNKLLIQTDEENRLDITEHEFLIETAKYASFIQPSIWNEEKAMAIFTAVHPQNPVSFTSDVMLEFMNTNSVKANIVVQNENGEIFTNKLEDDENKQVEEPSSIKVEPWVIATFVGIVILALVLFVYVYRKNSKRSGGKKE